MFVRANLQVDVPEWICFCCFINVSVHFVGKDDSKMFLKSRLYFALFTIGDPRNRGLRILSGKAGDDISVSNVSLCILNLYFF